jgi:hypothetical protein
VFLVDLCIKTIVRTKRRMRAWVTKKKRLKGEDIIINTNDWLVHHKFFSSMIGWLITFSHFFFKKGVVLKKTPKGFLNGFWSQVVGLFT